MTGLRHYFSIALSLTATVLMVFIAIGALNSHLVGAVGWAVVSVLALLWGKP